MQVGQIVGRAVYRPQLRRGHRQSQGTPTMPFIAQVPEELKDDALLAWAASEEVIDFVDNDDAHFYLFHEGECSYFYVDER
jgi:hypothetical protein